MIHKLKIFPCEFTAVERGEKKFDIQNNKHIAFQKGDTVTYEEYDPSIKRWDLRYTGRQILVNISYVTSYKQQEDHVVFCFSLLGQTHEQEKQIRFRAEQPFLKKMNTIMDTQKKGE